MVGMTREEKMLKRHRRIVEAACGCFIAKGFHQTGMRDIAREAGVSLGNLYNHFENKEALVAEIAKLEAEELNLLVDKTLKVKSDPVEAIEAFLIEYLKIFSSPDNMSLSIEILSEALRNPSIAVSFVENAKELNATLSEVIKSAQQLGKIDDDLEPAEAAAYLRDIVEGLAVRNALEGKKVDEASFKSALGFIRKYLGAKAG